MITVQTLKEVVGVSDVFEKRKVILKPLSGTPLERLCFSSNSAFVINADKFEPDCESISKRTETHTPQHHIELAQFSNEISGFVNNHLSFTKNTVKPIIMDMVEKVQKKFDTISKITTDLKINVIEPNELYYMSSFETLVDEYASGSYNPSIENLSTGVSMTSKEIIDLIKVGDKDIDDALVLMSVRVKDTFVESVFNSIFKHKGPSTQTLMEDAVSGVDAAILTFLITNKLFNNPLSGTDVPLKKHDDVMYEVRAHAGYMIKMHFDKQRKALDSKKLVLLYDDNIINVNGEVYREWKEAGNVDNTLFGASLSLRKDYYVSDIEKNKIKYDEEWSSRVILIVTANNAKSLIYKKEALAESFIEVRNENTKLIFGNLIADGNADVQNIRDKQEYSESLTRSTTFVKNCTESEMLNIWSVCTNMVCECLFWYTSSKDILKYVETASISNPGIQLREALLLATIEYVTDYVAAQISAS